MSTPRECPKYGILSPPEAVRCDCGYSFTAGADGGVPKGAMRILLGAAVFLALAGLAIPEHAASLPIIALGVCLFGVWFVRTMRAPKPEPAAAPSSPPTLAVALAQITDEIFRSPTPADFFVIAPYPGPNRPIAVSGIGTTISAPDSSGAMLLLFTSEWYARDYASATGIEGRPARLRMEDRAGQARSWIAGGVTGFVLNRCPRCDVFTRCNMEALGNPVVLRELWAADRAVRALKRQQLAHAFMQAAGNDLPRAANCIQEIIDHVDPGIPEIHYARAWIARKASDETKLAAALESLSHFAQDWIDLFHRPREAAEDLTLLFSFLTFTDWTGRLDRNQLHRAAMKAQAAPRS